MKREPALIKLRIRIAINQALDGFEEAWIKLVVVPNQGHVFLLLNADGARPTVNDR